jgi:hypothetical protein
VNGAAIPTGGTAAGSTVLLAATVTPAASTGTVTFYIGSAAGTQVGTCTITTGGTCSSPVTNLPTATNSLVAVYAGNGTYLTSTSPAASVKVVAGTTSTTSLLVALTSAKTASISTAASGVSVTLTATPTTGATGSVTFYDGVASLGTVTIASGTASLAVTTFAVGSHSITAAYAGSATYDPSTSGASSLTVTSTTTTALAATVNGGSIPAGGTAIGSPVTLVVTVTPSAATGNVTITNTTTSTVLGTGALTSGSYSVTVSFGVAATNSLTATYAGSSPYLTSTSTATSVKVVAGTSTTTALTPSLSTVGAATALTLSAAVTPSAATGTVAFYLGGSTLLGTGSVSSGTATLTRANFLSPLVSGPNSITAKYEGSTTYDPSTSSASVVTDSTPTTTALSVSAGPYYYGASVTLNATVTPSAATGTVSFYGGSASSTLLGTCTLNGLTTNTCSSAVTTTALPMGSNSLTAVYAGNSTYATSSSGAASASVSATSTQVAVVASVSTTSAGTPFNLTATVTPSVGTATVSAGSVTFYDSSTELGKSSVNSSGIATLTGVSLTTPGKHYLIASYGGAYNSGTAEFDASLSPSAKVTIDGTTPLLITASSPSVAYGAAVPAITPSYSGFTNGDTSASLSIQPTCTTVYSATSAPGSAPATSCSGAVDPKYEISYAAGSVTVTQASQTIGHWWNSSTLYGTPVTLSATASSGLTVTYSVISGPGSITGGGTTVTPSGVGTIVVAANVAGTVDYTAAAQVTRNVTVYPAPLTITASSPSAITYGAAIPPITASFSTFAGTDTSASLSTQPNCFTPYLTTSGPATFSTICYGAVDPNYDISYTDGSFVVNKATPTVTAASSGTNVYGTLLTIANWAFTTCTAVNPNNGGLSVPGTCAWTNNGATPHVGGVLQGVTFTPGNTTNYNTGTGTASVTVTKASLTVGSMPTASSVPFNSVLANSRLSGGTATSNVTSATVPGSYSWATGDSQVLAIGSNPENVTFSATVGTDFNTVTTTTNPVSVTVTKATPTGIVWPTNCSAGNYTFTYGQALSLCVFSTGSTTTPSGGTFAWTSPSTKPAVGTSVSESVTYTPAIADQTNYTTATGTVKIAVQAVPAIISSWPSASSITFGQALSSSILTGGSHNVPGTFAWTASDNASTTKPGAGSPTFSVTFTPTNTSLYGAVTTTSGQFVTVVVNQATPTGITWPAASSIAIAGTALSNSTLSPASGSATGVSGAITGEFGWTSSVTLATAGTSPYSVTFTPDDSTDYTTVSGMVNVSANTCGFQDSSNPANLVYSTAVFVFSDAQAPSLTGAFPLDVEGTNESAICAVNTGSGDTEANVTVAQPFITSGSANSSSTDANNYGTNSAVLAYGTDLTPGDGAVITITDDGEGDPGSISTASDYSNGVFASMGGAVNITDTILSTAGNYARGLVATKGGTLIINNVQASTNGNNSSAIVAGDGSSNSVTVNGGAYTSAGAKSSGIRAAGTGSTVSVNDGDSSGTVISAANGAAAIIEGANSVSIVSGGNATTLSGALGDNHGIYFYYNSTLADATPGTGSFSMNGGYIVYTCDAASVPACAAGVIASDQNTLATVFSVANTTATISLTDVTVTNTTNSTGDGILLTAAALHSGTTGSNGGNVTFTAAGETLTGDIVVDAISTANISLAADTASTPNPSVLTGAINAANSGAATVSLTIDAASSWVAADGPSYLTALTGPGAANVTCLNTGLCHVHVNGVLQTGIQ